MLHSAIALSTLFANFFSELRGVTWTRVRYSNPESEKLEILDLMHINEVLAR